MLELIGAGFSLGWPMLVFLVGLILYFQASIPDPVRKKKFPDQHFRLSVITSNLAHVEASGFFIVHIGHIIRLFTALR